MAQLKGNDPHKTYKECRDPYQECIRMHNVMEHILENPSVDGRFAIGFSHQCGRMPRTMMSALATSRKPNPEP